MAISRNPRTINPVATGFVRDERTSDPFVREALFGSPDTPGLIAQATQAANRVFGAPAILRETADLDPFEQLARLQALQGIGSFQPFLSRQQELLDEGTDAARIAANLQFDPRLTERFYNPFEQRVVQQTIDDIFKSAEIRDAQQRARDIERGGESAFGSRARLSAAERQSALGRGLGEALAAIRSGGFETAQRSAIDEFGRQARAREGFADRLSRFGDQYAGLGTDIFNLGQRQRSELTGLGQTARDLAETRLGRQFDQAVQTRTAPLAAARSVQGFIPQYQSGFSDVRTTYGMPQDPLATGIGTFLNVYGTMNPYSNVPTGQSVYRT